MYRPLLLYATLILNGFASAQLQSQVFREEAVTLQTRMGNIYGTLIVPDTNRTSPVALIIAGSGPTDRDGNNPIMRNNHLRLLAEGLARKNIATLRYDKRAIGESMIPGLQEMDLRFEHYAEDAAGWIRFLGESGRFSNIIVIGHSEGSLIGMLAAQDTEPDGFISIAGPGETAANTIRRQLRSQSPALLESAEPILDSLKQGLLVRNPTPVFYQLFRPSVQPYMVSWFRYDPVEEIGKLGMPVLILQGSTDIQVTVSDAEALKQGNDNARLAIIPGMNHILKAAPADRQQNLATYSNPDLPVADELIRQVADFTISACAGISP